LSEISISVLNNDAVYDVILLAVWRPLLPYVSTAMAERQSARMSKITSDGLTRSGTGCFVA